MIAWDLAVYQSTGIAFAHAFGLAAVGAAGMLALILVVYCPVPAKQALEAFVLLIAVGLIGSAIGHLGGLSRSAVVGNIVPAILVLLGGASVYLFGLQKVPGPLLPFATLLFVGVFFIAYQRAAILRTDFENYEFCRERLSNSDLLSDEAAMGRFMSLFEDYCPDLQRRYGSAAAAP